MTSAKLTVKRGDTGTETVIVDESNLTHDIAITLIRTIDNETIEWFKGTINAGQAPNGDKLTFLEQGQQVQYQLTGNKVIMGMGKDHENGQRFNNRHKFKNYVMLGEFKTGKDQEKIEMKTDGGCHGCDGNPTEVPIGMWYELGINVSGGSVELQTEYPHPTNHDVSLSKATFHKDVTGNLDQTWIKYAVMAYSNSEGHRVIKQFANSDANGTPELCLHAVDDEPGKIFPHITLILTEQFPDLFPFQ